MANDEDTQPSHSTAVLPVITPTEVALAELMKEVRGARADISLVSNDLGIVKDRVGIIESWKNDQDARASRNSAGVKNLSATDEHLSTAQAATHALTVATAEKVELLTTSQQLQTEILKRVDRFFDLCDAFRKHPLTKLVAAILVLVLGGYAASKGLTFK